MSCKCDKKGCDALAVISIEKNNGFDWVCYNWCNEHRPDSKNVPHSVDESVDRFIATTAFTIQELMTPGSNARTSDSCYASHPGTLVETILVNKDGSVHFWQTVDFQTVSKGDVPAWYISKMFASSVW